MVERLAKLQTVRADIQPIGTMTFYAVEQVDTPLTHKIVIRWLDWVDTTHVVFRVTSARTGATWSSGSACGASCRSTARTAFCVWTASWSNARNAPPSYRRAEGLDHRRGEATGARGHVGRRERGCREGASD